MKIPRSDTLFLILAVAALLAIFCVEAAFAHDEWHNGDPVPDWVKSTCCGLADAHRVTDAQIHTRADGWHVDGYNAAIPYGSELPTQDDSNWIFYRDYPDGTQSRVYCFFTRSRGT